MSQRSLHLSEGLGDLLRYWRGVRKMSQLDLAGVSGVSTRHLSFVESGRSAPSRDLLVTLAQALDVPLRERNALLQAGGYAALYPSNQHTAPELAPIMSTLRMIVNRAAPYPSLALDGVWNVLFANPAAEMFLHLLAPDAAPPHNVARILFTPIALARIGNWEEVTREFLPRLTRDALVDRHEMCAALGRSDILRAKPDLSKPIAPVVPLSVRFDDTRLAFFSTISTLGTPHDATLQDLRIETYYPADEATEAALRHAAA
jgi:transcriptional regulator with XRE-family HTH domain